jgi:hypothetical protein
LLAVLSPKKPAVEMDEPVAEPPTPKRLRLVHLALAAPFRNRWRNTAATSSS